MVTGPADHPVEAEADLAYQGAPSPITSEDARQFIDSVGPPMTEVEFEEATNLYFQR